MEGHVEQKEWNLNSTEVLKEYLKHALTNQEFHCL